MKNEIMKAMKDSIICSKGEAITAIEFVIDLAYIAIEHTRKTEPYATNYIKEMTDVTNRLGNLIDMVEDNL